MGQTTDQIENEIELKRADLKSNLDELQTKVKTATDWRHYFQNHTGAMIAAAVGGGMLLSTMVGNRKRSATVSAAGTALPPRSHDSGVKNEVLETVDTIKSALVGVAASKLKGMLGEVVPGFTGHLEKAEGNRTHDSVNRGTAETNH